MCLILKCSPQREPLAPRAVLDQGAPKAEEDAAGALWNLTELSSANCAALLEASGVRFLLGLIQREAISSRGAAVVPMTIKKKVFMALKKARSRCPSVTTQCACSYELRAHVRAARARTR